MKHAEFGRTPTSEEWGPTTVDVLAEALDWLDRFAEKNPDPELTRVIAKVAMRIAVLARLTRTEP